MSGTRLVNKRILIVEDDNASHRFLEIVLEAEGCFFEVAVNGQEAVDKVKNGTFDVVLMDIRMPVMNGFDATKEIRRAHQALPIIAVTAHAMPGMEEKCLSCGMNDYVTKPFEKEHLIKLLVKWTKNKGE